MIWMDVDTALAEVPVNTCPLVSATDFKTVDEGVTYDEAGMELYWHFVTTAGATTVTAVTPTTAGIHDWAHQDHGMYTIEIPDTGGTVDNDTEGFGYFTGKCTATLAWRGPTIGFRAAGLNDLLMDSAHSATRGLAGTALPAVVAGAASGIPLKDASSFLDVANIPAVAPDAAGGLPTTTKITDARLGALTDWIDDGRLDALLDAIKAKTDNLPADPADDSDIDTQLAAIAGYIDTEIGSIITALTAIKAKTDGLNFDGNNVLADVMTMASGVITAATFTTGALGDVLQRTTIAAYTSNTSFTLTAGSANDDAYNGCLCVIQDQTTAAQKAVGVVSDYTGATKTVTLAADPCAAFTFANGDIVTILAGNAALNFKVYVDTWNME